MQYNNFYLHWLSDLGIPFPIIRAFSVVKKKKNRVKIINSENNKDNAIK